MLIVKSKKGESIERMLRRYRRKHKNSKIRHEYNRSQEYTKPSVKRRRQVQKAIYKNQMEIENEF
ncbi:MAG: 30S ribosomal protein S21 [Bacteroidetes bacterium]|nr:30S ribosomal protein S21 [Bacteroidota bacterium]MCB0846054.1 30S ribosomal protein S21 [Bacteroidota bacterium]